MVIMRSIARVCMRRMRRQSLNLIIYVRKMERFVLPHAACTTCGLVGMRIILKKEDNMKLAEALCARADCRKKSNN